MKKVALITGGAGFIGSHLCDLLIEKGCRVICMDNLLTGKMGNVKHLLKDKNFEFVNHNVTKYIDVKGRIDYVLHFASPASPVDYLKLPIQTLKVGSLGTHNALGVAKDKRAVFLLASTSEVYGDPHVNPQPESYWGHVNPVGVRGCYDESKRFAEAMTMAYQRYHRMDTRIVRIFNTYGERMRPDDGRAIPNFINQALADKPITIYGRGRQTRSFCYISDMVKGIYGLLVSKYNMPMNIGNPKEMSLLKLADIIIKLSDSRSRLIFKPLPVDDPKVRCPDIAMARKALGWRPVVNLEEGLARTTAYFKNIK